jgi:vancomycin resistance protein YoaR
MELSQPRTQQPDHTASNPWPARLILLVLWAGMLGVGLLAGFGIWARAAYQDLILPGVFANSIPLGGLTQDEAATVLSNAYASATELQITLRDGGQTWTLSAQDLGITVDAEAAAELAMQAGRADGLIASLTSQLMTHLNGQVIRPQVIYDQAQTVASLQAIAMEINREGQAGGLEIRGLDVIATPTHSARILDIPATLARIDYAIENGFNSDVPLVIAETPASIDNLEQAAEGARLALSAPLVLSTQDQEGNLLGPWEISREQIASLLDVRLVPTDSGSFRYEIAAEFAPFSTYLDTLAPGLIASPKNGRFHFNETSRQIDSIQPAISGRVLDVNATIAALNQAVFSTERNIPLRFSFIQPTYHNNITAAELGITERIAEATTYFAGSSANRRINIAVSVSKMDGVIIPPGAEFSFNSLLGDLDYEHGFVDAPLIVADRTVAGIGGGVCQVSTTIFRAAFSGGFTIIERNSHGYRVGYYEQNGQAPGLDAAIWTPDRDFRFQNDTPYHLLIEASIYPANDSLQFRFYSTNTGRIVEIEAPRVAGILPPQPARYIVNNNLRPGEIIQVEPSAEGADVNVTRTVTAADGTLIRKDNIFTHYLPWGAMFEVAPGDQRLANP